VSIAGETDLLVVPLVNELVSGDARHVVFELRQVTFIDGSGFDLLSSRQRGALRTGVCAPGSAVAQGSSSPDVDRFEPGVHHVRVRRQGHVGADSRALGGSGSSQGPRSWLSP
jgi:hypothetical protein